MKIEFIIPPQVSESELSGFLVSRDSGPLFDESWSRDYPDLADYFEASNDESDQPSKPGKRWLGSRAVSYSSSWQSRFPASEAVKIAISDLVKTALGLKVKSLALVLDRIADTEALEQIGRALGIATWRFDRYRDKQDSTLDELECRVLLKDDPLLKERFLAGLDLAEAVNLARATVNEPANRMVPERLAEQARELADESGFECEILDQEALKAGDYRCLLAVGQGSQNPPRMVILRYQPAEGSNEHLALVGKGVSFDTGGISLKPGKGMHEMKSDLSGAAAVLGTMRTIARLRPKKRVTGIIVSAENMIGPSALKPGDIIRHKNGKFIQVDNTDAEGRLCLIDGIARAAEEGATTIVDIATLTGACIRALGTGLAGMMGNDEELLAELASAGMISGERVWPFPLLEEYANQLETPHADYRNIGGAYAGQITAGLFLQAFVPKGIRWAHLDIAGPAYFEKGWKYFSPGATGFGTQLLADWLRDGRDG